MLYTEFYYGDIFIKVEYEINFGQVILYYVAINSYERNILPLLDTDKQQWVIDLIREKKYGFDVPEFHY